MPRLTYNQLKNMSVSEIGKLDEKQSRELLKAFREKFRMREKAFSRAGKNVYSPALDKMQTYYRDNGVQPTETMTRNKAQAELFRIQEFFNAQTGDVKGARRIMREQDARIFGVNERGTPLKRMTIEERTLFWSTYEEFMKSNPRYDNPYQSGKVQQHLGEVVAGERKEKGVFMKGSIGMIKRLNKLQSKLQEGESDYGHFGFNIFSGRGPSK